ncbi:MAG: glycosyltransferase [Chlorobi bacterium]|nr:glycosyltransferase [Chlorobiota bacterium]
MNILHIITADSGGAAKACIRLHKALLKDGVSSDVLVYMRKNYDVPRVHQLNEHKNYSYFREKLDYLKMGVCPGIHKLLTLNRPKGFEIFTSPNSLVGFTNHPLYQEADIVHLHWVSYVFDFKSFFRKNTKPVVWTQHDMNAFTGGCHHADDCDLYKSDCNKCPQLNAPFVGLAKKYLKSKKDALKDISDIHIVSPSKWMGDCVSKSALLQGCSQQIIPNGLDLNVFRSSDKSEARQKLGLPEKDPVILFVADSVGNKRKGMDVLSKALNILGKNNQIALCTIGKKMQSDNYRNLYQFGFVSDEKTMALLYSAADVTVVPSKIESFGQVAAESMACGIAAVAFGIGGSLDVIDHKLNGYLAQAYDPQDLADGIMYALENRKILGDEAVKKIEHYFDIENVTKQHIELYKKILNI